MRKWGLALVIAILVFSSSAAAAEADDLQITVEAAGILSPGADAIRRDATVPGGYETYIPSAVVSRITDTIPAVRGTSFGVRFTIRGLPASTTVRLRKVVRHPVMKRPDGTTSTGYETTIDLPVDHEGAAAATEGYGLDEDFELLPGHWSIEIWLGERRLLSETFSLVQ